MDRFSDDREDFEPSNSGFDPDEAISRYLAQRKSREAQAEEEPDAELDPHDEGEEPLELDEPLEHHPHQPLHPSFPTHRPTFGRKGL